MPIKTRSFVVVLQAQASLLQAWQLPSTSPINWGPALTAGTYAAGNEAISYETGEDGRFRPCSHTKDTFSLPSPNAGAILSAPGSNCVFRVIGCEGLPVQTTVITTLERDPKVLTDAQWAALNAQALSAMLPSMASGFSLVNFIYELKDFRHLAQSFWNRRAIIQRLLGLDESGFAEIASKPLASLSKAYLNYSFNWKPFVSDLMQIYQRLVNTDRRLKELWDRQNKPQTRHYSVPLDSSADESWSDYSADINPFGNAYFNDPVTQTDFRSSPVLRMRTKWQDVPTYHATCRYFYSCPGLLDDMARVRGWLDSFGVRLDPSIIWNAIPFSFIIDWVVNVGGYLRRFSTDNLKLNITVEDFCSSTKASAVKETELFAKRRNSAGTLYAYSNGLLRSRVIRDSYVRRVGIPNLYSAISTSGLSGIEASLGVALVTARGGNNKSRRVR